MSMERLTGRKEDGHAYVIGCPEFEVPKEANTVLQSVADKCADLEDILGDTYDLDRLRELVEADKAGRCEIHKVKDGETVYSIFAYVMDIYVQKRRCRKTMDDFINKAVVYKTAEKMEELARARFESAPAGSEERKILYAQLIERVTFKYMIASEHAANVREDVQGEWEWFEEKLGTPIDGWDLDWGWRCSRCKDTLNDEYDDPDSPPKFNFCPNCGARMK